MSKFYVACDLGAKSGRVMLGTLNQGSLTLSEVRRFQNLPIKEKDSLQWNIPQLYQETLDGLRAVGTYEEAVESVSCDSWAADYLLFEADCSLITPTYHHRDPRTREGMQKVLSLVPKEMLYQETGVCPIPANTLFQLGAEKPRRLSRAQCLLPVADAFNYLLSGVPRLERSMASTTQLYNPKTQAWSDKLISTLGLKKSVPCVRRWRRSAAWKMRGSSLPVRTKRLPRWQACPSARERGGLICAWVPGRAWAPKSPNRSSLTKAAS